MNSKFWNGSNVHYEECTAEQENTQPSVSGFLEGQNDSHMMCTLRKMYISTYQYIHRRQRLYKRVYKTPPEGKTRHQQQRAADQTNTTQFKEKTRSIKLTRHHRNK